MRTEILIIGGGVIGLCIAYKLRLAGTRRIAIVERGTFGSEASWAAGGMLGVQAETDSPGNFLDLCRASLSLYPEFIENLTAATDIDAELDRTGTLKLVFNEIEAAKLQERAEWQRRAGLAVEQLTATEIRKAEPFISPNVAAGLFFPDDWQVDNRKLLAALRRFAETSDIDILENTEAGSIIVENGRAVGVQTQTGEIHADHIVLATGAWTSLIKLGDEPMPLNVKPIRGQMLEFHTAKRLFRHVLIGPEGYLVPRADGRLIAGSTTEDVGFDSSNTPQGEAAVLSMAVELSPSIAGLNVNNKWAGLRPMAADGMPVIGTIPGVDDMTVATAHYRNGILLAPITAEIAAGQILNEEASPWMTIFGTERLRFSQQVSTTRAF
ncbi:MAG: glycine oxidase ThiO [Acidobacteriota bacterium]|nr:MAG: glycine oxidase ThiO [Acidobacteriota bacterium]